MTDDKYTELWRAFLPLSLMEKPYLTMEQYRRRAEETAWLMEFGMYKEDDDES